MLLRVDKNTVINTAYIRFVEHSVPKAKGDDRYAMIFFGDDVQTNDTITAGAVVNLTGDDVDLFIAWLNEIMAKTGD